ncbi:MAG: hypothetical protein ACLFPL_00880 [Candidatus Nanoarchaeia archaeon]
MLPLVDLNEKNYQIGTTSLDFIILMSHGKPIFSQYERYEFNGEVAIEEDFGRFEEILEGDFRVQPRDVFYYNGTHYVGNLHSLYNSKPYDQVAGFISFPKN